MRVVFRRSDWLFFAVVASVLFAAFARAQGPPVPQDRPDVPRDSGAPSVPGVSELLQIPKAKPVSAIETPAQARDRAAKEGKPYAVFVGVPLRSIAGVVCVRMDDLDDGGTGPRIMVYPLTAQGYHAREQGRGTLPATATDAAIRREAGLSLPAIPFRPNAKREARDFPSVEGDSLAFLRGMESYTSATRVQVTFRRWSGMITSASRESQEARWNIPGGLTGVEGWSSTLYRSRGRRATVFLVRQDPSDGNSAVTWNRRYPDGSQFADVLRNADGEIFEVRYAEKSDGQWDRYILYRNVAARPHGYDGIARGSCVSCHRDKPGSSEYGGAAIPGGDEIFSESIDPVESGRVVQGGFGTRLN